MSSFAVHIISAIYFAHFFLFSLLRHKRIFSVLRFISCWLMIQQRWRDEAAYLMVSV
jgi:hypothetical protein